MTYRTGIVTLLVLLILGLIVWYWLGGSIDIDADIRAPRVEFDPGEAPNIDVRPAPEAEAGDNR